MPDRVPLSSRRRGFTFVELLLAIVLAVLVAGILALLLRTLLAAGTGQAARLRGPFAARAALRTLSRETACAFAPPVKDLPPLELSTSTEPGKPAVRLAFYLPVEEPVFPEALDIHQVIYEVQSVGPGVRELRRLAAPCSGPHTNAFHTNILYQGAFELAIEALDDDKTLAEWPPPDADPPVLPGSLRFSLRLDGEPAPLETEALIQCAHGIESPVERTGSSESPSRNDETDAE